MAPTSPRRTKPLGAVGSLAALIWLSGLVVAAAGCAQEAAEGPARKIGLVIPLSGVLAPQGNDVLDAATLAVDLINEAGGIHGAPIALVVADDRSTLAGATEAVERLSTAGVELVIGSVGTPLSRAVASAAAPRGLTAVAPSATGAGFRGSNEAVSDDWPVVRLCATQPRLWQGLVSLASDAGVQRLGVIADPSTYGAEVTSTLTELAAQQGLVVQATRQRTGPDDDVKLLAELFADGRDPTDRIDGLVIAASPEGGAAVIQALAQNFSDALVPVFLTESLATEGFVVQATSQALEAVPHQGVLAADEGRWFSTFSSRYTAAYGAPPRAFQAHAFDAVVVSALAMGEGGQRPLWQRIVGTDEGTLVDAGAVRNAMALVKAGGAIDYDGASGPLAFDSAGDVVGQVAVWRVVNGVIALSSPP